MLQLSSSSGSQAPPYAMADVHRQRRLSFPPALERRFERDIRLERSARMWRQGLTCIVAFAVFYVADWLAAKQVSRHELLVELGVIAPLCIVVNLLMCLNPPRFVREGSVAMLACLIASTYLWLQHGKEPVAVAYAAVGAIVSALFASVVMRLRFRFALTASAVIAGVSVLFLAQENSLRLDQKLTGGCLTVVAIGIGMMANYDSEWEERLSYLRLLENERHGRKLAMMNERLSELSTTDNLTGLPNRRAYEERFAELWGRAEREGFEISLVVADVDHFKMINDAFGHSYGDEVLRRVGSLLRESLRSQEDCVARFGGEEFVALLPGADAHVARTVAERIRHLVEVAGSPPQQEREGEPLMWVTVSCGYATCPDAKQWTRSALLEAADRAMYAAKAAGRNRAIEGTLTSGRRGSGSSVGAVEVRSNSVVIRDQGSSAPLISGLAPAASSE